MRYPAEETAAKHQRILEQSSRLFRERGFSGVSVSEIMKATGLTHGSFYNHFESKDDLVAKSIEHASRGALETIRQGSTSAGARAAYLAHYLSAEHRDDAGVGCMMAALGTEVSRAPYARPAFTHHVRATVRALAAPLRALRKRRARGDAIRSMSMMVGALILSRAVDDPALSDEILREVRAAAE